MNARAQFLANLFAGQKWLAKFSGQIFRQGVTKIGGEGFRC